MTEYGIAFLRGKNMRQRPPDHFSM
ncbi:MAG: hypothetical protein ABSC04_14480 [Syntrophobacteraceae bacterium]